MIWKKNLEELWHFKGNQEKHRNIRFFQIVAKLRENSNIFLFTLVMSQAQSILFFCYFIEKYFELFFQAFDIIFVLYN